MIVACCLRNRVTLDLLKTTCSYMGTVRVKVDFFCDSLRYFPYLWFSVTFFLFRIVVPVSFLRLCYLVCRWFSIWFVWILFYKLFSITFFLFFSTFFFEIRARFTGFFLRVCFLFMIFSVTFFFACLRVVGMLRIYIIFSNFFFCLLRVLGILRREPEKWLPHI